MASVMAWGHLVSTNSKAYELYKSNDKPGFGHHMKCLANNEIELVKHYENVRLFNAGSSGTGAGTQGHRAVAPPQYKRL